MTALTQDTVPAVFAAGLPPTIVDLPQWVPCYPAHHPDPKTGLPIGTSKRPMGGPTSTFAATLDQVYARLHTGQLCGFCFRNTDPYVCIDLDNTTDLTPALAKLLEAQSTYIEYSVSGNGLHIVYRTDKARLAHRKAQDKHTSGYKGSVFIRDQFVVLTGNRHPRSADTIEYIEPFVFESLALSSAPDTPQLLPLRQASLSELQREANFAFEDISKWLAKIPTRVNKKLLGIYSRLPNCPTSPDDYEHWRVIAAATHYAAALHGRVEEGALLFDYWSQGDPSKYQGFEDCRTKYLQNPPRFDNTDISHKTLQKIYSLYTVAWPMPVLKDGKPTTFPQLGVVDNFMALVNHYGLELRENSVTKALTVVGDPKIVAEYFMGAQEIVDGDSLASGVLRFIQNNGFAQAGKTIAVTFCKYWYQFHRSEYSPVAQRILASPPSDPRNPRMFSKLMETLAVRFTSSDPLQQLREAEIYTSYVKKSLMGIIRAHFYRGPYSSSTGIVILQGAENTYKSTWIRQLLPPDLSARYIGASQLDTFSNKEIQLEAARWQIVLYDEVEKLMSKNDSKLKSFVVQEYDMYRPLYAASPIQVPRRCILWGTTNRPTLPITDNGSRRIHVIPVVRCDTSAQKSLDMIAVLRELYDEFMLTPPAQQPALWSLSVDEIVQTNKLNEDRRQHTDLDAFLEDMYNFEEPFNIDDYFNSKARGGFDRKSPRALNTIAIARKLSFAYEHKINTMQLEHTLRRVLSKWTGIKETIPSQLRGRINPTHSIEYGQYIISKAWKFWLLPPEKEH
jgi:hypothetical protein